MRKIVVREIKTEIEIAKIRPFWDAASDRIENAPDYYLAVNEVREAGAGPLIFMAEENGYPVALLLARMENIVLRGKIAYTQIARFELKSLSVIYNGYVGRADPEIAAALFKAAQNVLIDSRVEVIQFRYLAEDSIAETAVESLQFPASRKIVAPRLIHRTLSLPDTYDDISRKRSARSRKRLRYYARSIEALDGFRIQRITNARCDLDGVLNDLETVAKHTYQRALGAGFVWSDEFELLIRVGLEKGWIRLWIVYGDGKPLSFAGGYLYKGRFMYSFTGFDPEYSKLSIGSYVLQKVLEDLIENSNASLLDYGFGDAEYKRLHSDDASYEQTHYLFANTWKGWSSVHILNGISGLNEFLRGLVRRFGAEQRLKSVFRRHMSN